MKKAIFITFLTYKSAFIFALNIPLMKYKKPYYYDDRIHNVGNIGIGGWLHATVSPFATKMIDDIRYDGYNIREEIIDRYVNDFNSKFKNRPKIIDLCCGVGISTYHNSTGIDSSIQMIEKAKKISKEENSNKKFIFGNAEIYGKDNEFDCATIMFAMHEIPDYGHINIIENCKRISKYNIIIVDISPNYKPSKLMLTGEPYLNKYLDNFDKFMNSEGFNYLELIEDHVRIWYY